MLSNKKHKHMELFVGSSDIDQIDMSYLNDYVYEY